MKTGFIAYKWTVIMSEQRSSWGRWELTPVATLTDTRNEAREEKAKWEREYSTMHFRVVRVELRESLC